MYKSFNAGENNSAPGGQAPQALADAAAPVVADGGDDLSFDYTEQLAALENASNWGEQVQQASAVQAEVEAQRHAEPASEPDLYDYGSDPGFAHAYAVPEGAEGPDATLAACALQAFGFRQDIADVLLESTFAGEHSSARDFEDRRATEAELRGVWGTGYDTERQLVANYIKNHFPPAVSRTLHRARLPDGRALLNIPAFVVSLAGHAKRAPTLPKWTGDMDRDIEAMRQARQSLPDEREFDRDPAMSLRSRWMYGQQIARKQK